ncbi:Uma2 family endonuclease [Nostoc sp. FACHB-152]|uniref:Uma2 family endonuclease n=1 Tax=unclassified Nostoc TaxID=2593658 RepID=UPI001687554F|nr:MULTISPECIES: Uma2 family endonuclease [unclassified Nostoc]MBD2446517.1 Uma2 family endonuclease [Nostoc sp. FACHB-152]MBD2468686.1 Uma2 family endonuclease [Nostoc sp. FACHB-145]
MSALVTSITLEEFLQQAETKPAAEYFDGQVSQKPMPQGEHSLLQLELCEAINRNAKPQKIAVAFPELRCVFGGAAIVPDVAVFRWERIPRDASGKISNCFEIHPDWAIEILSPDQSQAKVLRNLLHCCQNGTELGWLIFPDEASVLGIFPNQRVEMFTGTDALPILSNIDLSLTVEQVFSWLTL